MPSENYQMNIEFWSIDQFTWHHRVVHNGRSSKLEGSLLNKNAPDMLQILQGLSYAIYKTTLLKFATFRLFSLALGLSPLWTRQQVSML